MRLTEKLKPPYERVVGKDYVYTSETRLIPSFASVEQKLGQLEDLEDELGIDLITLFKALKQKFVYHNAKVKIELLGLHIKSNELYLYGVVEDTTHAVYLSLKDYGKTWALTKEELL